MSNLTVATGNSDPTHYTKVYLNSVEHLRIISYIMHVLKLELIKQLSDDFNKQDLSILKWTFVHQCLTPHGKRSIHAPTLLKSCLLNWWYFVSYLHLQTEWSKCSFGITLVLFQLCICLEGNQVYECSLCQNRSLNP